jgi:hypothetical protein
VVPAPGRRHGRPLTGRSRQGPPGRRARRSRDRRVGTAARGYPVLIGSGLLDRLDELLPPLPGAEAAAVGRRPPLAAVAGGSARPVGRRGLAVHHLEVPAGEEAKRLEVVAGLYERLAAVPTRRADPVVAVGGGATTDVAGFAAATWLRGRAPGQRAHHRARHGRRRRRGQDRGRPGRARTWSGPSTSRWRWWPTWTPWPGCRRPRSAPAWPRWPRPGWPATPPWPRPWPLGRPAVAGDPAALGPPGRGGGPGQGGRGRRRRARGGA